MAKWRIQKFYCVEIEVDGLDTRTDVEEWCLENLQFEVPESDELINATIEELTGTEYDAVSSQEEPIEMIADEEE